MISSNLNLIPIFIEVVKNQSFSRAGIALGMTKSKVSKSVSALESELGVKLLHRTTRKLSLTEVGEDYFEQVAKTIHELEVAQNNAIELLKKPKGNLKILVPMSFGRLHLATLISKFVKKYPNITIEMELSDEKPDLLTKGFDLALRAGKLENSSMIGKKICELKSVICTSKSYLKNNSTPSSPKDLTSHNCLVFSLSSSSDKWTFSKGRKNETIYINGSIKANNSDSLRELALLGNGIVRLPTFIAGADIRKGKLIQLLDKYEMPSVDLHALFPHKDYLPLKVRTFVDFLSKEIDGDNPYWDNFYS